MGIEEIIVMTWIFIICRREGTGLNLLCARNIINLRASKESVKMSQVKEIARQRIRTLFRLAMDTANEAPDLAQRYVEIARRIAMRSRLRIPKEYRRLICRHCKSFIFPGVNCRVRIQPKREPHMVITCLNCGKHMRIPLKGRRGSHGGQV